MAFRTNYRFQRTERDRAKQAKKEEKLKKRQERGGMSPAPDDPKEAVERETDAAEGRGDIGK
jgi:hypothetical protein